MYELALSEWHVTPEYINENWTEEMLGVLFRSRAKRLAPVVADSAPVPAMVPVNTHLSSENFLSKWSSSFKVEKVN